MTQWKFEEYSDWSRRIAKTTSKADIEKQLGICVGKTQELNKRHLNAIKKENRKVACTQRLAQSGLACGTNQEKITALKNALELHEYYPERCFKELK